MTTTAPETSTPPLARARDGAVEILTLSRPASRNSLSDAMLEALAAALADIKADRAARAVVLAAEGPVFSAGHDLKEMTAARQSPDRGRAYFADIIGRCAQVMQAIVTLPQPVIAAVQGTATAAGCQLVATCDLAVAAEEARFCTPGVNIGLFCSTPMVALSRNIGAQAGDGDAAHGRDDRRRDSAKLGPRQPGGGQGRGAGQPRWRWPSRSRRNRRYTVQVGKEAFYRQREMPLPEAYAYATQVMVDNMLARDAEEGISAFIDKRHPTWEDR